MPFPKALFKLGQNALRGQAGQVMAQSWKIVPELVEMLHVTIGGARNIEIR